MNAPEIIAPPEGPIAAYSPVAVGLADLRHRFKGVVFDVSTAKGDKEARGFRRELVTLRTTLEAKRKELKAPALAKDIRLAAKVGALFESEGVARTIGDIEAVVIDASFEEFQGQAQLAKDETLAKLREMHAAAVAREQEEARLKVEREAEAARLAAERAELERQRQEQEAAARAEAERLAAARAAQEAELRAQREAQERELAAQRAAQAQAEAEARVAREAEEQRLAAERAELRRQQEAAEAKARDERRKAAEAATRIERSGPVLLAALQSVRASGAWPEIEDHIREAVERAIEEATGQPA